MSQLLDRRSLGRSGLDHTLPLPDNVWDVDCSTLLDPNVGGINIHGEYFQPGEDKVYALMHSLLVGTDRGVLVANGVVPSTTPRQQPVIAS